jgi:hypothetical protein
MDAMELQLFSNIIPTPIASFIHHGSQMLPHPAKKVNIKSNTHPSKGDFLQGE